VATQLERTDIQGITIMAVLVNDEKQAIVDMMAKTSIEVTPGGAAKVDDFRSMLRPGCKVYVTFLPRSDFADTVAIVRRLKDEGFNPVPHFAARSIPSSRFLEANLASLQDETGVTEGLLIGGGVNNPVGDFSSSIEVLRTGLFEKYGIQKMGLAGHPEGSPDISPVDCALAIREKNNYALQTNMKLYLATQFVFEAAPVLSWEKAIRAEGNQLPIYVGIPGLATVKTLLRHAQYCGVGASMRFLTRNPLTMVKLSLKDSFVGKYIKAPSSEPSELMRDLVNGIRDDPKCLIQQCHMYPLGGLKKSAEWMYKVQDGQFNLNTKGFSVA
jgi:methylenetetrahydrofolate reductase (NADPH)